MWGSAYTVQLNEKGGCPMEDSKTRERDVDDLIFEEGDGGESQR